MKQFRSQTHLMPGKSGPTVHQQKKSVTKVPVEAVGSVHSVLTSIIVIIAGVGPVGGMYPLLPPPQLLSNCNEGLMSYFTILNFFICGCFFAKKE